MFNMTQLTCCKCGIQFSVPEQWRASKQQTRAGFYCPNGHSLTYEDSDNDKLRRENNRLRQEQAQLIQERIIAEENEKKAKLENTRLKKRATAGVCPCCNRTFRNMARHMQIKHPKFKEENHAKH